jgi:hypothetical protein
MAIIYDNYIYGTGNGPSWHVKIRPPVRPVKSYYEETVIAAEMLYEQKRGKIHVCLSGGMDSEYALAVLQSLGMEVVPVILRTKYNAHDILYAFTYCLDHKLTPLVIDLDFDKFVESGQFLEIATSTNCAAYQYIATMWLTSQIDGTVVTGETDPHMYLRDGKWYIDEIEPVFNHLTYYQMHDIHTMPYFVRHTPEQFLAFLTDPTMQKLANNQISGKTGSYSSKIHVYNNQDVFKLEQRKKQNGYELVETSEIFQHPDMQLVKSWKDKYWGSSDFEYNYLINTLLAGNIAEGTNGQD